MEFNPFNQYLKLKETDLMRQWVLDHGERREYMKNEYFVRENDISKFFGYIKQGSFRYLKWNFKEEEQVVGYSFEDDFVVEYSSFLEGTQSPISAQAIIDSEVWAIPLHSYLEFLETFSEEGVRVKIAESLLSDMYNRMLNFSTDSGTERYLRLINRYPKILNLVSLKEIASYINVRPETLSRIRKKNIIAVKTNIHLYTNLSLHFRLPFDGKANNFGFFDRNMIS